MSVLSTAGKFLLLLLCSRRINKQLYDDCIKNRLVLKTYFMVTKFTHASLSESSYTQYHDFFENLWSSADIHSLNR
jgi:hypothetical protein